MCYLVTGVNPLMTTGRYLQIFDTEEQAKVEAEKLLTSGHNEVSVWKQIAVPKIEKKIIWE